MRYIADLHIHSKYSRACSKDLDLEHNAAWAKRKGIGILGTGDFTHPAWFKELSAKLVQTTPGLYSLKGDTSGVLFMATTELSCIYKQGDKVRRIHLCIFAPDLETVAKINTTLERRGVNLKSDGRPIMGLHADELTKIVLDAHPDSLIVPAHIWTPWFAVFGSNSGFDTLEECFGDMTQYIHAIETGLSSDPAMNWRLSALDTLTILSNSDAHSPANLAREATAFDINPKKVSYNELRRIIVNKDPKGLLYTIEFFPEEGKYHADGHRACNVMFTPTETKKHHGICPVCKKKLTIGVLNRIDALADRAEGVVPKNAIPYKSIVPLQEVIAEAFGVGKSSKKVQAHYMELTDRVADEFTLLLDTPLEVLTSHTNQDMVNAISNIREGKVKAEPGYDGVYGTISALGDSKLRKKQQSLF